MKPPTSVKASCAGRHALPFLFPAISLLCLLLVGSQFLPGGNFQAHSATARGLSVQRHLPALTHVSVQQSSLHRKHHVFQHKTKKAAHQHHQQQKKKHVASKKAALAASATMAVLAPHATMTPNPEATQTTNITSFITAMPSVTVTVDANAPDFYIRQVSPDDNQFNVGNTISYVLLIGNKSSVISTTKPVSLTVTDVIPLGLKQIIAKGTDWQISLSDTVGPAVMTAQYTGSANTTLPSIVVTGILTQDAAPSITNTASVVVPDDKDMDNNTAVSTALMGAPTLLSPTISTTATPAPSKTLTLTPTAITQVIMTSTPHPTPRITITPKPRVTPQPTMILTIMPTLRPTPRITITPKPRVTPYNNAKATGNANPTDNNNTKAAHNNNTKATHNNNTKATGDPNAYLERYCDANSRGQSNCGCAF